MELEATPILVFATQTTTSNYQNQYTQRLSCPFFVLVAIDFQCNPTGPNAFSQNTIIFSILPATTYNFLNTYCGKFGGNSIKFVHYEVVSSITSKLAMATHSVLVVSPCHPCKSAIYLEQTLTKIPLLHSDIYIYPNSFQ